MIRHRHQLRTRIARSQLIAGDLDTALTPGPGDAAYRLLADAHGRALLREHYRRQLEEAARAGGRCLLESPTRQADLARGRRLGLDPVRLADLNRSAIALLADLRHEYAGSFASILIAGGIGPRERQEGEETRGSAVRAYHHHLAQVAAFATTEADLVLAGGLGEVEEAVGIVRAARQLRLPLVIGLRLGAQGRLAGGETAARAVARLHAEGRGRPLLYRLECAAGAAAVDLPARAPWLDRVLVVGAAPVPVAAPPGVAA